MALIWSNRRDLHRKMSRAQRSIRVILQHPISGRSLRSKVSGLSRYFAFHLRHFLFGGLSSYPWIDGLSFLAKPGMAGIVKNIYTGLADFEEMAFLLHFLRSNDLFVDVGANVGGYSLLASGICGSRTIAIEPVPDTYEMLKKNLHFNNLQELVSTCQLGIGSTAGTLMITTELGTMNRVVTAQGCNNITPIKVITLDELLSQQEVTMLKIDVEGYEREVLDGAEEMLDEKSLKVIVIEMLNAEDLNLIHARLVNNGFSPYSYDPFSRCVIQLGSFNRDKFNTLYLRDLSYIKQRVKSSREFSVLGMTL